MTIYVIATTILCSVLNFVWRIWCFCGIFLFNVIRRWFWRELFVMLMLRGYIVIVCDTREWFENGGWEMRADILGRISSHFYLHTVDRSSTFKFKLWARLRPISGLTFSLTHSRGNYKLVQFLTLSQLHRESSFSSSLAPDVFFLRSSCSSSSSIFFLVV